MQHDAFGKKLWSYTCGRENSALSAYRDESPTDFLSDVFVSPRCPELGAGDPASGKGGSSASQWPSLPRQLRPISCVDWLCNNQTLADRQLIPCFPLPPRPYPI